MNQRYTKLISTLSVKMIIMKVFKVFLLFSLLQFTPSVCEDSEDIDREKRTIGLLFRSFVDNFQTQRQPAPMVTSFHPPRQTQAQRPQSTKADLLSSSKTFFHQKKNLFKSSTQAPDTEFITPSTSPTETSPPSPQIASQQVAFNEPQVTSQQAALNHPKGVPQQAAFNQPQLLPSQQAAFNQPQEVSQQAAFNQPQEVSQQAAFNQPQTVSQQGTFNRFQAQERIPPSNLPVNPTPLQNYDPSPPFKAQILILPLQGHSTSGGLIPPFDLQSQFHAHTPNLNYQAEIYLHPHQNGVHPLLGQYSGRYSPRHGWHDTSDILSRGIYSNYEQGGRQAEGVVNLPNINQPESVASYSNAAQDTGSAHSTNPTGIVEVSQQENYLASRRDNYFEGLSHNSEQPLFLPYSQQENLNPVGFGQPQSGYSLGTPDLGQRFNNPEDMYRSQNDENPQNNNAKDQTRAQSLNPKQVKGVNSIPPHRPINNSHDYLPQRGGYQRYPENVRSFENHYEQSHQDIYNEIQLQHPDQQIHPNQRNEYITQRQYPPRIGNLPEVPVSSPTLQMYHHPTQSQEMQGFVFNNYFKRSNKEEKPATENCSNCNKNK